ncbi:hypothetical protein [Geminocystis herdmanii]|nr:hypothetical protein [Geminocystis herdmanii]
MENGEWRMENGEWRMENKKNYTFTAPNILCRTQVILRDII